MKQLIMGIATLIAMAMFTSCDAQTPSREPGSKHNVPVCSEAYTSLRLEWDTTAYEINIDFEYIDDVIYYDSDSATCVEYWDPDVLDEDYLEYVGYVHDNTDPYIRAWIAPEDFEAMFKCLVAYRDADDAVREAINNHWCILASADGLHYQFVRRFNF